MAHVGKHWPVALTNDLGIGWEFTKIPPMFLKIETGPLSTGSLTIPWRSLSIISEQREHTPGDPFVTWKVTHPSISDQFLKVIWELVPKTFEEDHECDHKVVVTTEAHINGTFYGYQPHEFLVDHVIDQTTKELYFFSHFFMTPTPALWSDIFNVHIYTALWPDVPDYHPYRI